MKSWGPQHCFPPESWKRLVFTFDMIITAAVSELKAQIEAQKATQEFQRAVEILRAAKETIALAEERLLEEDSRQFDSAWQEMLNHATNRVWTDYPTADTRRMITFYWIIGLFQVMEAEQARMRSEAEHKKTAANYNSCMGHMRQLEKKLKRSINKSRSVVCLLCDRLQMSSPTSLCECVCVRAIEAPSWWSPDVSCVGCAVLGCAPSVRAKECDYSQRSVILLAAPPCFSSLPLNFSSFSLPSGHILNWKPSITYNLRYVC